MVLDQMVPMVVLVDLAVRMDQEAQVDREVQVDRVDMVVLAVLVVQVVQVDPCRLGWDRVDLVPSGMVQDHVGPSMEAHLVDQADPVVQGDQEVQMVCMDVVRRRTIWASI